MTSSFGEMGSLLKQAQKMQRDLDRVREELRRQTVEGTAGTPSGTGGSRGKVRVLVTGDRQVTSVEISEEALAFGKPVVEELVLAALRDGISKAAALAEASMARVTGGLNLPGLY